jgi:hypothetical protein
MVTDNSQKQFLLNFSQLNCLPEYQRPKPLLLQANLSKLNKIARLGKLADFRGLYRLNHVMASGASPPRSNLPASCNQSSPGSRRLLCRAFGSPRNDIIKFIVFCERRVYTTDRKNPLRFLTSLNVVSHQAKTKTVEKRSCDPSIIFEY